MISLTKIAVLFQVRLDHNSNSTNSILNFVPRVEDGGKFLKCRAENVEMAASQVEDSWNLEINCKIGLGGWLYIIPFHDDSDLPLTLLSLGPNFDADKIKEGDDVYFECSIEAKPAIYKTSWWFNVSKMSVIYTSSCNLEK